MILTGRVLAEIGELLHGPRWREWMAGRLGKSIRTIKRYESGEAKRIPATTRRRLIELMRYHEEEIARFRNNLSG